MEVFPSKNIHFKPCRIHETVYQTVVLLNSGDTPIHYDFIHIPSCFNIFPKSGSVQSKGFSIILFSFSPNRLYQFDEIAKCKLNMKDENIIQFKLYSICDQLRLTLENDGKI